MTRKPLYTGTLYWPTTLGSVPAYEPLGAQHQQFDAVVVGGGMSGILCGHALAASGIRTAIVERGDIAGSASSASTGLIQFSNDIMLSELIDQIGERKAVMFYTACRQAVEHLAALTGKLVADCGFKRRSSLYFASTEQDVPKLKQEYETLRRCGFDVEWWPSNTIRQHFPFSKPSAIVTHGDAELNPYRFIHRIAEDGVAAGLTIYEHTEIVAHDSADGVHRLTAADGGSLTCSNVVFAVGYEPDALCGQLIKSNLNRSFVLVTEPQSSSFDVWHERFMIWETARPYLYMRTTSDNRIIIGGLDEEPPVPIVGRHARTERIEALYRLLRQLFPTMTAPIAYEWSATFGESRDGLPFIGRDPARTGVYYSLGYGGNGTVYSVMASQLIRDMIHRETPPLADIVALDRTTIRSMP
ncbi:NAD(P)/FAD-dependent oxidoreductase [Paenibacillus xylaniclasticus]|uniref:NAD(P)/FAD-dependent oxidoreductase n=1 Tax=Paenibacillus xylaniclasticus TaxID=588083 RepID=UPI000FD7C718|nr:MULTISPECIES: FAD-dependent oxidoreductase [Paenibacillus]GFN33076.1 oxidoreductase [Paenibacillus curdlanolyticus]